MSADLAAFLLAQIEREEQFARFVGDDNPQWHLYDGNAVTSDDGTTLVAECQMRIDAEYIVHWDPARVLAECESKRVVLGLYLDAMQHRDTEANATTRMFAEQSCDDLHTVVRLLALPFADHPDYDPAWRP